MYIRLGIISEKQNNRKGVIMTSLDIRFMNWCDEHGLMGDIVRVVVGVILLIVLLLPVAYILTELGIDVPKI